MIGRLLIAVMSVALGLEADIREARASPVTWEFAGEITSVIDPTDFLGGGVTVGDPFSVLYTFESATPDGNPDNPNRGSYVDAVTEILIQLGNVPFQGGGALSSAITVTNDDPDPLPLPGLDKYLVLGALNPLADIGFVIELIDSTGTIFSDDALPLVPPALEMLDIAQFVIGSQFGLQVMADLTFLVPDPGTLSLLGLGALALMRRGRRSRPRYPRKRRSISPIVASCSFAGVSLIGMPSRSEAQEVCGCMDMVFVIDVTGSMNNALGPTGAVKDDVASIAALADLRSGGDLRLGLITFSNTVTVESTLTTNTNSVLNLLAGLTTVGGISDPEASDEALRELLLAACIGGGTVCDPVPQPRFNVPFRSECIKHAILITDALPAGCNDGYTEGPPPIENDREKADARADEAAVVRRLREAVRGAGMAKQRSRRGADRMTPTEVRNRPLVIARGPRGR